MGLPAVVLLLAAGANVVAGQLDLLGAIGGQNRNNDGACHFHGERPSGKFARLREDAAIGAEVVRVAAYPRQHFNIQAMDGSRSDGFFTFTEVDRRHVSVVLQRSLETLVDQPTPTAQLTFRMACRGRDGSTTYLPVTVHIVDVNDNAPEFVGAPYNVTVDESTLPGLPIFRGVFALDRDKPGTANSEVTYSLSEGNADRRFSLESRAGSGAKPVVVMRKPLDFEAGDRTFNITIRAQDHGSPPLSAVTYLHVSVRDSDDQPPAFSASAYEARITETYPITGSPVEHRLAMSPPFEAKDLDADINAPLHYDIIAGNEAGLFSIDPATGFLYQVREVDRDVLSSDTMAITVEAKQMDNSHKSSAQVLVHIEDLNDNAPVFDVATVNVSMAENTQTEHFSLPTLTAKDVDKGDNAVFTYALDDSTGAFAVDSATGAINLTDGSVLDREKHDVIELTLRTVEKTPNGAGLKPGAVKITINVQDENDNSPTFVPNSKYSFHVSATSSKHTLVGSISAEDADPGANGTVKYRLKSGTDRLAFGVDATSGQIRIRQEEPLNRERYVLNVLATDQCPNASLRKSSWATVEILVDGHVRPRGAVTPLGTPTADATNVRFPEAQQTLVASRTGKRGTDLGKVAVDNPSNIAITWTISHTYGGEVPFGIDADTGVVRLSSDLSASHLDNYFLRVIARSAVTGHPLASTKIRIAVLSDGEAMKPAEDQRENTAEELEIAEEETTEEAEAQEEVTVPTGEKEMSQQVYHVKENLEAGLVGNLSTILGDVISSGQPKKAVTIHEDDHENAGIFRITDSLLLYSEKALDREKQESYNLTIRADGIDRAKIRVLVDDENDNSPSFDRHVYLANATWDSLAGSAVSMAHNITVTDEDKDDDIKLELLGSGSDLFVLDSSSSTSATSRHAVLKTSKAHLGQLLPESARQRRRLSLRLRATDSAGHITEAQVIVHVTDPAPVKPPEIQGWQIVNTVFVRQAEKTDLLIVQENTPVGTLLARISVAKAPAASVAVFAISGESVQHLRKPDKFVERITNNKAHFQIDASTGDLTLLGRLSPAFLFRLNVSAAVSNASDAIKTDTTLVISVADINDHAPKFTSSRYEFSVEEGTYADERIGEVLATDADFGLNAEVSYNLSSAKGSFWVHPKSGFIFANGTIDRASLGDSLELVVTATDESREYKMSSSAKIVVRISEDSEATTFRTTPAAVTSSSAQKEAPAFRGYNRLAPASSIDSGSLSALASVSGIEDVVAVYEADLVREAGIGTEVATVQVDNGINGGFELEQLSHKDLFELDSSSGVLKLARKLDSGLSSNYSVVVVASSNGLKALAVVHVSAKSKEEQKTPQAPRQEQQPRELPHIQDQASSPTATDHKIFKERLRQVEVVENSRVPAEILDLRELLVNPPSPDSSSASPFSDMSLSGDVDGMFKLSPETGFLLLVASPDRERADKHHLKIRAQMSSSSEKEVPVLFYTLYVNSKVEGAGGGDAFDEVSLVVSVLDENDNRPEFLIARSPKVVSVTDAIRVGDTVTRAEAFDADYGQNAELRYSLVPSESSESLDHDFFLLDSVTGDVSVARSLASLAGRTLRARIEARDNAGDPTKGLAAVLELNVHVVGDSQQLQVVLSGAPELVAADMDNITRSLSSMTGLDVHAHTIGPHKTDTTAEDTNGLLDLDGAQARTTNDALTDLYVYALESSNIVEADKLVRTLSPQLVRTRDLLSRQGHGLLEVRAGPLVLSPDGAASAEENAGKLGALEIAFLAIASAIFFGGLIALVVICSVRYRKTLAQKSYPAPLAVPLPGYSMESSKPRAPPNSPGKAKAAMSSLREHHLRLSGRGGGGMGGLMGGSAGRRRFESSEETSDTCIDEHLEPRSNFSHSGGSPNCKQKHHRVWRRAPVDAWAAAAGCLVGSSRDRDSGLGADRRDSSEANTCACNQSTEDSSCDCCSDEVESRLQGYSHLTRSPVRGGGNGGGEHRRHKSLSPARRPRFPLPGAANNAAATAAAASPGRSRSSGQPIKGGGCCRECLRRSQRRSCNCCGHCDAFWLQAELARARSGRSRSTRWETYHDWNGADSQRKRFTYNTRLSSSPSLESLRMATSSAAKAHSWRGDHPLKQQRHGGHGGHGRPSANAYFEHERRPAKTVFATRMADDMSSSQPQSISMPFRTTHTYEQETLPVSDGNNNHGGHGGSPVSLAHGIKLMAAANKAATADHVVAI